MKIKNFITKWSDTYFSIKEKSLKRERITSFFLLLIALIFFALNFYLILKNYRTNEFEVSRDLHFGFNLTQSLIYQLIILLGLLVRFSSLRFNSRFAFRFSEVGVLLSFFGWLGYSVWTSIQHWEISKIADVNYNSHLNFLDGGIAVILSFGFIIWIFYKIIFLIAVTWKTVRK